MSQRLFDELVEEHKDKFNTTMMFGTPISEINDDSLRACICVCSEIVEQQRKSAQQERNMYKHFRAAGD